MICCKIIANFNDPRGKFSALLQGLSKMGDFLFENGTLFFANVDDPKVAEARIKSLIARAGYHNFVVFTYDKDYQPRENEYINGWLTDKLVAINYHCYEQQSQAVFHRVAHGLDLLDKELEAFQNTMLANSNEEAEKTQ